MAIESVQARRYDGGKFTRPPGIEEHNHRRRVTNDAGQRAESERLAVWHYGAGTGWLLTNCRRTFATLNHDHETVRRRRQMAAGAMLNGRA